MKSQIKSTLNNPKVILIIIIFLQILLLLFFMNNKASFFCDDIYSYTLSNGKIGALFPAIGYNNSQPLRITDKWIPGDFYKKYITVLKNSRFDYSNVYDTQALDCHPPFYYYLLHTVCSFFPETFSKWYGFSLNLLFFIITQIILYSLSYKLFNSYKYALLTCFLYGFSAGSTDCAILIRMYSLLTMLYLLLLYLYIICLEKGVSAYSFFGIVIVVLLGSLTQYHFYVYAFFITLTFVLYLFINKKYRLFWHISLSSILGVVLSFSYYPYLFIHIGNSHRGGEALSFYKRISPSVIGLSSLLEEFLGLNHSISFYLTFGLIFVSCVFLVIFIIKTFFNKFNSFFKLTVISNFIFTIFIYHTINYYFLGFYYSGRFLYPICTIVTIIIVAILYKFNNKYLITLVVGLSILSNFCNLDYYYPYSNPRYSSFVKLGELTKGNNLVVYTCSTELLQTICPHFINANKVYIISVDSKNKVLPELESDRKTYLFYHKYDNKNFNYKKVINEGWLWNPWLDYDVYEMN